MPALVNSKFGEVGIKEADGTMLCCFSLKKSRKDWRISCEVMTVLLNRSMVRPTAPTISSHLPLGKPSTQQKQPDALTR